MKLLCLLPFFALLPSTTWRAESDREGIVVESRARAGSADREFRVRGIVDGSPLEVNAALMGTRRIEDLVPFSAAPQVRFRSDDGKTVEVYFLIEPPLLQKADMCLRVTKGGAVSFDPSASEVTYSFASCPAPPARSANVVRIGNLDGSWRLEPHGAKQTRAEGRIHVEVGDALPQGMATTVIDLLLWQAFLQVRSRQPSGT